MTVVFRNLSFAVVALLISACTTPIQIRNAAPLVSHVTSVTPTDDGHLVVYWLYDYEEDPVDITLAYAVGSGACESFRQQLTLAMEEGVPLDPEEAGLTIADDVPGFGHHFSGLSSGAEYPGQPHELMWDTSALSAADEVCLYLLPDDREGKLGDPLLTPTFKLSEGYAPLPIDEEADVTNPSDIVPADI